MACRAPKLADIHQAITPGGQGHFGMIFIASTYRRTGNDTGKIITAVEILLGEYPSETGLANGEAWL